MSRVLPILFNTDMVRAVLREENPKIATRRVVKGCIPDDAMWGYTAFTPKGDISCRGTYVNGYGEKFFKLPYQIGDILYVRETFTDHWVPDEEGKPQLEYCYKADGIDIKKEAARIWLKVTDIRVERLQEMNCEDAMKEGIDPRCCINLNHTVVKFSKLWNSTIKQSDLDRYGWAANPWVWEIEFSRCEKPKGELCEEN